MRLPDFLYIGTGKAGTTWLFKVLSQHPEVFITSVKETNFFDLNYQRGLSWYGEFFQSAPDQSVVGEISHRYIHKPETADRIAADIPNAKIVIGYREPVDYCVSDYLYAKRNGRFSGTLEQWCDDRFDWNTIRYHDMIQPFLERFGRDRIHLYDFARIKSEPESLLRGITDFLGVQPIDSTGVDLTERVNIASTARNATAIKYINIASKFLKRRGGQRLIAAVKANKAVQGVLFRPLAGKPTPNAGVIDKILAVAYEQIEKTDKVMGTSLLTNWQKNYPYLR